MLTSAGATGPIDLDPGQVTGAAIDDAVFDSVIKAIGVREPYFLTRFAVGQYSPLTRQLKVKAAHPDLFGALDTCVPRTRAALMDYSAPYDELFERFDAVCSAARYRDLPGAREPRKIPRRAPSASPSTKRPAPSSTSSPSGSPAKRRAV